jgi:hypothetical protein
MKIKISNVFGLRAGIRSAASKARTQTESDRPGLSQGGTQVVPLRRMMHYVRRPEEATFMAGAMKPVIAEIVGEERQYPCPPGVSDLQDREAVDKVKMANTIPFDPSPTTTLPIPIIRLAAVSLARKGLDA